MNSIQVAGRLREQLEHFSGIFSPRFSKPQRRFFMQMVYGIQASQDVKLSSIGRALGEAIELKKTEERLSHHLGASAPAAEICGAARCLGASGVALGVTDPAVARQAASCLRSIRKTLKDSIFLSVGGPLAARCVKGAGLKPSLAMPTMAAFGRLLDRRRSAAAG